VELDFCNTAQRKISFDDHREMGEIWRKLDSTANISLEMTVEEALRLAMTFANPEYGLQAFVTGQGRLIGPALSILEPVHQNSHSGESKEDHF